jgi:hypothetical protein
MKRFPVAFGIADVESFAGDYSQRLGCRPDLLIPGKYALWRTDAVNLSIRKVGHEEGGSRGGMVGRCGQAWRCYLAGCGKTRFIHEMPMESSIWRQCQDSLRMLKKAVQQGRSERRGEAYASVR